MREVEPFGWPGVEGLHSSAFNPRRLLMVLPPTTKDGQQ